MKKIVYGLIIFLLLCFIAIAYIEICYSDKKQEVNRTELTVKNAYSCKFENDQWVKSDKFILGDEVYVCTEIKSNNTLLEYPLTIYIFKDNIKDKDEAVYDKQVLFSLTDVHIPIHYVFLTGRYYIAIYYIRDKLCEIPIDFVK